MTLNEQDKEEFKTWTIGLLKDGPTQVVFIKKDGSERSMLCTLNPSMIPPVLGTSTRKKNDNTVTVYDLDKDAWRSFKWDSVKSVESSIQNQEALAN